MTTAMKLFNGIGVILYTNSSKNIITDEDHAKLDLQNQGFVFKDQQMQKQFTRNKLERIKKHLKDLTSCFEANHSMTYEIGSIAPFSDTPDSHIILESAKECASCRKTEGIGNLKSFWMADATSENNTTGIAGKICNGYLADNNAAQEHADKNSIGIPLQIIMRRDESVQTLKRGKQKMYHAPGMIVGCAGSGKTSLLKRLQGITVKEIENNIQSTRGVDVFIDMFDVTDTIHDDEQQSRRILSILDFAGQCAYYASHQIFLNRWSFFLIMMKDMDDVIGKEVCCQEGSVYKCWKFRDKFLTSKEELKPAADFGEMSETPEDDVGFPHVLYHKSSPDSYTEEEDHSNEPADMLMEYDHSHRLRRTSAATELWMQTELDVCYVDLYDSDDDLDIILEDTDYDIPFNVESPTETEDSYRRTGRRHQDSVIIIISEEFTSQKQHILSGGPSLCTEGHSLEDELSLNHHTFWNLMSSVDQERKRKVFCDSELSSKSYLDSGYLDSDDSLQSSEYQKDPEDFDLKNPFHVSEQVVRWEDGISAQNVETEMVNVNLVVENITKNFNTTVQEELCKDSNEKSKGNIKFAEKMPDVMENDKPLLGVTLCALLVNLCVIAAVFAQSGVEVMKYSENTKMQNKKASNKQMLQTSRREKRKKQRILRDIINWQISLRRNTTVMYDSHALNCRRIYPSTSDGPTALQQIANETGVDEAGENVNQSMRGEVNPNNQTQGVAPVNGFADVNQVTHPRDGNLPLGRYGGRDVESRFFSNPVMGAERPTDCDPLSRSMPAQLHSNNVQTSEGTLPAIAEGENVPSHLSDNNSVQATEERECHVTALEGSTFSLAPELDGPSLTSTDTLSDLFTSLSLSSVEGDEAFRYEWIRLKTFSEWPLNSLFSTVLARAGWVSLGEGDRARCYSCHIVHDGWRTGDNPRHFHDQNCRFLGDSSDNIPITRETPDPATRRTLMTDLERAQQTTDLERTQQTTDLERAQQTTGLRSPGMADNAPERPRASETGNTTTNLMSQDNRPQETRAIAMAINNQGFPRANTESPPVAASRHDTTPQLPPDQPVYTTAGTPPNSSSREAQLEALRRDPMGINFERPKYPSYAILAVRISSYTDWPAAMTQTPRDMALAGFFYAGYGDYTRCFFCGGGLRNWEAGDDPWVEHARWFSKCAFVRQNRGQQFIDLVLRRAAEVEEQRQLEEAGVTQTNVQTGDPAATQAKEDKIMKSAAVTSIRDMGYEDETIKAAITKIKSRLPKGKHKVSAQEILEVIFELADSQRATETSNNQSQSPDLVDQSETVNERATSNPSQSDSTTERINQSTNEEAAAREASNTGACNSEETETNSLPNPTFDELTSLRHENTSLKDQILCKICMEKNVSIAFLPCGHLACCVDCAPAMRKCPICREFVRGTVKTFLV